MEPVCQGERWQGRKEEKKKRKKKKKGRRLQLACRHLPKRGERPTRRRSAEPIPKRDRPTEAPNSAGKKKKGEKEREEEKERKKKKRQKGKRSRREE